MICIKCGIKVGENDKFCPNCGSEILKLVKEKENTKIELPTDNITDEDIENGRALSIFCYFGPLVLIPAIIEKKNGYVIHNANQGFSLLLYEVFLFFARYIFSFNPLLFRSFEILSLLSILILCVFGIIYSLKGKINELPLIGKCNLLFSIKYRKNRKNITEKESD
ncbi:MAG: zinc-ribbon domain-containing protein, partial [Ruminococcus sp.]